MLLPRERGDLKRPRSGIGACRVGRDTPERGVDTDVDEAVDAEVVDVNSKEAADNGADTGAAVDVDGDEGAAVLEREGEEEGLIGVSCTSTQVRKAGRAQAAPAYSLRAVAGEETTGRALPCAEVVCHEVDNNGGNCVRAALRGLEGRVTGRRGRRSAL